MKAQCKKLITLFLMIFVPLLLAVGANSAFACRHHYFVNYVPMAICATYGTNVPLPPYVCCKLVDHKGHVAWGNTWVSGSCSNASPCATFDTGCTYQSPVFNTCRPINAECQFSYSAIYH